MVVGQEMLWHGERCVVLVEPVYRKGVIRNALIELEDGTKLVVSRRSLRKVR